MRYWVSLKPIFVEGETEEEAYLKYKIMMLQGVIHKELVTIKLDEERAN